MHYKFPTINHIDDVIPHIENSEEFAITSKHDYTIINYHVMTPDTFPPIKSAGGSAKQRQERELRNTIRRELRGIIFDTNGKIIARRLHKFFNVNECVEASIDKIDFSQPHVILEKLDGSMITPFKANDEILWGTKMGVTDVSKPVTEWVNQHRNYLKFADICLTINATPIFEWTSRKQRIVVDYPEDRLVLIAIRHLNTGVYVSYDDMCDFAKEHNIDVVKSYPGTVQSMQHLIDDTKSLTDAEGWVVRFNDGHMLKVKGEWYLRIHKIKDNLIFEKNIINMIVNETLDDAKSFMLEQDRENVEKFERLFWEGLNKTAHDLSNTIKYVKQFTKGDRKTFALSSFASNMDSLSKSVVFTFWDKDHSVENVKNNLIFLIKKMTNTQSNIDKVRHLWNNHKWNYGGFTDE